MIQSGDGPGFALEAVAEVGLGNLDRDDTVQPCIARLPHLTHSAFAERRQKLIRAEFLAD